MAKQSGLGDGFYIGGYNLSGDIGSLGSISGGKALLDVTGIDKSAIERIGGQRTGQMEFTAFWNDSGGQEFDALNALSRNDRRAIYARGTSIGSPAAGINCKQVNFDHTRGADGSLTVNVSLLANGYGIEWGQLLTAGPRTDSGATNGTSLDTTASASFGAQAYLEVMSFTGTSVNFNIQDSADNSSWADIAELAFTTITSSRDTERIATANTTTIRRYVRIRSSGTFSSCTFVAMIVKNEIAGQVF